MTRSVPAPGLAEVAASWWDRDVVPAVRWSVDGRRFELVVEGETDALLLCRLAAAPADPARIARALADGLAGCDFPPTGTSADATAVRATLRSRLGRGAPPLEDERA